MMNVSFLQTTRFMILKSFVREQMTLKPVEVEIVLTPGLPIISILGLPDKIIQESTKRIQTALLSQGYQLPKARQIIVNLWPREGKKSSLGLDLAIALGILHESGQKILPDTNDYIYGELDMQGRVRAPEDLILLNQLDESVLTGESKMSFDFDTKVLSEISSEVVFKKSQNAKNFLLRPPFLYQSFPKAIANLLKIVSVGEHSIMLAGPPGSGKTSFVDSVASFLEEPNEEQKREIKKNSYFFEQKLSWRPVVKPHHSSTALSLVGGGSQMLPGEIVRSNQGILILDELLEFSQDAQSVLREPMESGFYTMARAGRRQQFPCRAIVLATSNLCPCGEFTPSSHKICRCSSLQLRKYMQKLSGPFVDRFSIFCFSNHWRTSNSTAQESSSKILEDIQKSIAFRKKRGQQNVSEITPVEEIITTFESEKVKKLLPYFKSKRRESSCLRVARTIADLEFSEKIKIEHIEKSLHYTFFSFEEIKKIF